jgi:hypothetical protein
MARGMLCQVRLGLSTACCLQRPMLNGRYRMAGPKVTVVSQIPAHGGYGAIAPGGCGIDGSHC